MKRKEFLNWVGVGFVVTYLPVALAACTDDSSQETADEQTDTVVKSDVPDAEGYLTIGTSEELAESGYLVVSKSNVIVFRNSSNELSAVSLLCTHQGCKVDWKKTSNSLFCACHGSEFSADGEVLEGPANSPLSQFEVKEEDNAVLVKVG